MPLSKNALGQRSLGFSSIAAQQESAMNPELMMKSLAPEDLVRFGMIPEFIGRLPVVSVLDQLKVADLEKILLRTKSALVKQYSKLFAMDGVRLQPPPTPFKAIARQGDRVEDRRPGTLRAIMENIMLEVMYDLPQRDDVTEVVIDAGVVAGTPASRRSAAPASPSRSRFQDA